jgi:hypothetical protein
MIPKYEKQQQQQQQSLLAVKKKNSFSYVPTLLSVFPQLCNL